MPSFDVVSQVNMHELENAIDQANREISNRFDFKGTDSRIEKTENNITLIAPAEFQIRQVDDILQNRMSKRGIDIKCLEYGPVNESNNQARQQISVREGISRDLSKKITKIIKDSGIKVQASVQGEQVRVTGKKRDDLQQVIAILKKSSVDVPLQYVNFRD